MCGVLSVSMPSRQESLFEAGKSLLCGAPVLAAPNFSRPFKMEVDASASGAGAVLTQDGEGDVCHPVLFLSQVQTPLTKQLHH